MGAAAVSILRPWAVTEARSAFRAARSTGLPVSLFDERRRAFFWASITERGGVGLAALGSFLDCHVDLAEAPVEIGDLVSLDADPCVEVRSSLIRGLNC